MRWSPLTPARCPLGTSSGRPVRDRSFSTTAFCYLLPEFGATTLLRTLDTRRIDAYRERPLTEGELSRRTIEKILVQLLDPQARQAQELDRRQPSRGRGARHRPAHWRLHDISGQLGNPNVEPKCPG